MFGAEQIAIIQVAIFGVIVLGLWVYFLVPKKKEEKVDENIGQT